MAKHAIAHAKLGFDSLLPTILHHLHVVRSLNHTIENCETLLLFNMIESPRRCETHVGENGEGGAMAARKAHYLETAFESHARNIVENFLFHFIKDF